MINLFFRKKINQPILGHDIDKPKITPAGWILILFYLALPAMGLGAAIDLIVQLITGRCVGVWCLF
jgi:hypothetical protein